MRVRRQAMRFLLLATMMLGSSILCGCYAAAERAERAERIVPRSLGFGRRQPFSVEVQARQSFLLERAGDIDAKRWTTVIPAAEFQQAIEMAIRRGGLFARILEDGKSDLLLRVDVKYSGSHPEAAGKALMIAGWALEERATGKILWDQKISTEGHAKSMGPGKEEGPKHRESCIEDAARANLKQGLSKLGRLRLPISGS